jgi:hypothetical protein
MEKIVEFGIFDVDKGAEETTRVIFHKIKKICATCLRNKYINFNW